MVRRCPRDAAVTRERILASAELLFERQGVQSVTLEQVAGAIAMTRGAIYGHFRSRADLLAAVMARAEAHIAGRLAAFAGNGRGAARSDLEHALAAMLRDEAVLRYAGIVLGLLHHACTPACELCQLTLHIRARSRALCDGLGRLLGDQDKAVLLAAHLWGLLCARSLWLAPVDLAGCVEPLLRLYGE
ncbi:TetR family transcriptional regulator [Cupriavidus basilensis]|uniref:TetR family transcriptional regulator n=1 Tax=Cupriavidus basilensis TaxID=68895 RepID=A0ABT6AHY5_9BURK|nr:TetR family transcriptional regulator [Cupriavidus basilensis]MDF3832220.1 TetR family transcriptional regulator [Cupriavidus basilensis]